MAYNYEYPYVDSNQYNDDWLLSSMKNLLDEWQQFQADYSQQWEDLKAQAEEFVKNLDEETKEKVDAYLANVSAEWKAYEDKMNAAYAKFTTDITSDQTSFKSDMRTLINGGLADMQAATTTLQNSWNTFRTQLETEWTDTENDLNALKETIETYFDNLNVQTEINNKIDSMVSSGQFSTLIEPKITDTTVTWLQDHYVQGELIADKTLRLKGQAADSAITGGGIRALQALPLFIFPALAIYGLGTMKPNIAVNYNGQEVSRQGVSTISFIPFRGLPNNYVYLYATDSPASGLLNVAFYDETRAFLSGDTADDSDIPRIKKVLIPSYTAWVSFCYVDSQAISKGECLVSTAIDYGGMYRKFLSQVNISSQGTSHLTLDQGTIKNIGGTSNNQIWFNDEDRINELNLQYVNDIPSSIGIMMEFENTFISLYIDDTSSTEITNLVVNDIDGNRLTAIPLSFDKGIGYHNFKIIKYGTGYLFYLDNVLLTDWSMFTNQHEINWTRLGMVLNTSAYITHSTRKFPAHYHYVIDMAYLDVIFDLEGKTNIEESEFFNKLLTFHDLTGVFFTCAIVYDDGTYNLDNLTLTQSMKYNLQQNSGWLRFTYKAYILSQTGTTTTISLMKNKIESAFSPVCYDPNILGQGSMTYETIVNARLQGLIRNVLCKYDGNLSSGTFGVSSTEGASLNYRYFVKRIIHRFCYIRTYQIEDVNYRNRIYDTVRNNDRHTQIEMVVEASTANKLNNLQPIFVGSSNFLKSFGYTPGYASDFPW